MSSDQLIDDYLKALLVEVQRMPGIQGAELVTDVRSHVNEAIAEAGSDDEVTVRNILERLGTPQAIVDNYNATLSKAMANADLKDRFNKLGVEPHSTSPAEFRAFLANEKAKYSKLIADNNIKAD